MKGAIAGSKILVTGSTDGLGKLVAGHLAWQNAVVLLHGRNPGKGTAVLHEIYHDTLNKNLYYYNADFSSLQQVDQMADKILSEHDYLDILINNAAEGSGLSAGNMREFSADGFELRFAVNYLAQVLLTEKLLPLLKSGSVIINVASVGQGRLDFSNLMLDKNYDGFQAYKQSKTALIMYTFDLAERLKDRGIMVNAVHPASLMNTKMVIKDWGYSLSTVEEGAEAVENLLFPETTGRYYDRLRISVAIRQAYDLKARYNLRRITFGLLRSFVNAEKFI